MGAQSITEQDLLDAIEAFLPMPKQPGEYTISDIAELKNVSDYRAERALNAMVEAGKATFREVPGKNGKAYRYYKLVTHN